VPKDIDLIILATLSPDFNFPGTGVFVQRALLAKQPWSRVTLETSAEGLAVADAAGQGKELTLAQPDSRVFG
jgi:3-oxoacyl-[acyl-carrier-protein] synthase III